MGKSEEKSGRNRGGFRATKIFGSSSIQEIEAMSMLASATGRGNEMRALGGINNENRLPDQTEATAVRAGAEFPEQPLPGSRMNALLQVAGRFAQ